VLTLELADRVLSACRAKADAMGIAVSIVVVDLGGHIVGAARMDGARFLTIDIAFGKAHGCVGFHRTGAEVAEFGRAAPAFVSSLAAASHGRFFASLGSMRILRDGEEIGAVGISGGSGEQDHEIAQAGIDAVG
jgi:uncharacterized protein GlcG (DUF336 family)